MAKRSAYVSAAERRWVALMLGPCEAEDLERAASNPVLRAMIARVKPALGPIAERRAHTWAMKREYQFLGELPAGPIRVYELLPNLSAQHVHPWVLLCRPNTGRRLGCFYPDVRDLRAEL